MKVAFFFEFTEVDFQLPCRGYVSFHFNFSGSSLRALSSIILTAGIVPSYVKGFIEFKQVVFAHTLINHLGREQSSIYTFWVSYSYTSKSSNSYTSKSSISYT